MYTRILVAYDGSDGARAALVEASHLAEAYGASLSLVCATGKLGDEALAPARADSGTEAAQQRILDEAQEELDARAQVQAAAVLLGGDPVQAILERAEQTNADLIVTGSRGKAMLPQAVLGRVSSGVVSGSPCDVLVVHPRADPV